MTGTLLSGDNLFEPQKHGDMQGILSKIAGVKISSSLRY